jgi:hypothetical protein
MGSIRQRGCRLGLKDGLAEINNLKEKKKEGIQRSGD